MSRANEDHIEVIKHIQKVGRNAAGLAGQWHDRNGRGTDRRESTVKRSRTGLMS